MISIKWYELEPFNLLGWLGQESHKILSTHGRLLFFRVKGVDQNDQILRVMFIRRERLSANFLSSLWCEVALSCAKFFRTSCEHLTWGLGQLMRATEFNRWWMFELGEIAKTCVSFSFRVRDFQTKHVGQVAKNWALFHSTCFPNPKMETDHEYGCSIVVDSWIDAWRRILLWRRSVWIVKVLRFYRRGWLFIGWICMTILFSVVIDKFYQPVWLVDFYDLSLVYSLQFFEDYICCSRCIIKHFLEVQ